MIGMLKGEVALLDNPFLIVDVNGVGYKVLVAAGILAKTSLNSKIVLFTYTHVRDDILSLFGFLEFLDLKLFERLIGVSGIGPKTAMNIFSVGERDQIMSAVASGDVGFFTSVPRLGKKNAQKIIIELKGKLDMDSILGNGEGHNEVSMVLKNFGFTTSEIQSALRGINGGGKTTQEKIRLALKYLGK